MSAGRKRILIVDDSAVMRSLLRMVIARDPMLEVAGTASQGEAGLDLAASLRPDLVLLDVEMPGMGGLATVKALRARGETMPVVMCSALTQRGAAVTIEALADGASDYVAKPAGHADRSRAMEALAQDLLPKIRALTGRASRAAQPNPFPAAAWCDRQRPVSVAEAAVVAIGVSTGGPQALEILLGGLPAAFPLPVLVAQHMPELFTKTLADRLAARCAMGVREAAAGEMLRPGTVYVARGDWHMEVLSPAWAQAPASVRLTQTPPVNHCRPSVDVLLRSAVSVFGSGVLAVQLTGMGSDGLGGCSAVRQAGGTVLAQDEATSAVWGMPRAVVEAGLAQQVLPIQEMADAIRSLVAQAECARSLREAAVS